MKFSTLFRWITVSFLAIVVGRGIINGPGETEDASPPVPEPGQQIVLQSEKGEVPFVIERLNVYLTENERYPESFEFEGTGLTLVGMIPVALHVGYEENWKALVGHPIAFSRSLDSSVDSGSHIEIPGESRMPVIGGEFTIQEVGEGFDAKTPLTGELRVRCLTAGGEREYRGTFQVKGTTWG